MSGCIYRTEGGKCKQFSVGGVLSFCYLDGTCDCQISSKADRFRAMTDEELAEYIRVFFPEICPPGKCPGEDYCYKCWLDWLKSPVEETD